MTVSNVLQNFGAQKPPTMTLFLPRDRLTQIKVDAMKVGQRKGYEQAKDELNAVETENLATLSKALQDISFTQNEARQSIFRSLEPMIRNMVEVILPGLVTDALADVITAQILTLGKIVADGPIKIQCAKSNCDHLKAAIAKVPALQMPIVVVSQDDLQPFEVRLTTGATERHLDIGKALNGIRQEITEFYVHTRKENINE